MEEENIGVGMYRFVINKTYLNILLNLEYGTTKINEMAKKHGIDYFHLTIVLQALQKEGIITRTMKAKEQSYDIGLTSKGQRLMKVLSNVKSIIEETDTLQLLDKPMTGQVADVVITDEASTMNNKQLKELERISRGMRK